MMLSKADQRLAGEQGVDISKEFTINNTKCSVVNGKIIEVGNTDVCACT